MRLIKTLCAAAVVASLPLTSQAAVVQLKITVENLAPQNGISFAPLRVGFHSGVFDAFNIGQVAGPAIVSVAEGGSGAAWFPAFAAADPGAVTGTVVPNPAGPLLPGGSGQQTFSIDTDVNPFFTFAAMVVPSNDFFIGNDNPQEFRLFDATGNLLINSISQTSSQIWDAGSELFSVAGAAFLVNGVNAVRTPQNGVVSFNFSELARFNGEVTAAHYVFNSQLTANQPVYRIDFQSSAVVPEPSTIVLLSTGLITLAVAARRKRVHR